LLEREQLAYRAIRKVPEIHVFEQKHQFLEHLDRFIGRILDFCYNPIRDYGSKEM
jgi:hypothetical protein